jgi:hypothetical protein
MRKLLLLLLFVPIVSCSSGDDSSDDDSSNEVMTIQNSKFLKANKNTFWEESSYEYGDYFYIEEFDIGGSCSGILSSVNAEILIDTPTTFRIAYTGTGGAEYVETWTINGNTLVFDYGLEQQFTRSNNQPPDCHLD